MILVFLGAPGCGKGTIAKIFEEKLNFCHISTGDLIRNAISSNKELGEMLKQIISNGNLVSDEIVLKLLNEKLKDCSSNLILDGFPRNLLQAQKLDEMIKIDKVVYIDTPYDIIKERLVGRRTCENCGKVYNLDIYNSNTCSCGGKLVQREDDTPHIIEKRFKVYEKETMPLVQYYQNQGKLLKVESNSSSNDTFKSILNMLEVK